MSHYYHYQLGMPKKRMSMLAVLATALLFAIAASASMFSTASADPACQPAGTTGLTANYINEAPKQAFDVTCDIGIYINEDTKIRNAQVNGSTEHAQKKQHGIYVDGANADVSRSTVTVSDDYPHQFVSVMYTEGATGTLSNSEVTGAHRVGVLVRGAGTHLEIKGNLIAGTGAKTSGWAENGVQVDQGATANIVNNTVSGHWWDGESNFASSGVMIFGNDSSVINNSLADNEFNLYFAGDNNNVRGNTINSDVVSQSSFEFTAYGILFAGSGNHLSGNKLTTTNGAVGVYVFGGSKNKITGNKVSGFAYPLHDGGSDNMVRGLVTPAL